MDADTTTDWRGLSANLANAAHRLRLTAVNLASDPGVPDLVRRSPGFLAMVRDAELVEAFLERWREAERLDPPPRSDLVVTCGVAPGVAVMEPRTRAGREWLALALVRPWERQGDNVTAESVTIGELVRHARADDLFVSFREA